MMIEAVAGTMTDALPSSSIQVSSRGADFSQFIEGGLARVDGGLKAADLQLRQLAAGEEIAVHDVMITMEKARMELMLMAEVRNRLVEAYQELTRMQL